MYGVFRPRQSLPPPVRYCHCSRLLGEIIRRSVCVTATHTTRQRAPAAPLRTRSADRAQNRNPVRMRDEFPRARRIGRRGPPVPAPLKEPSTAAEPRLPSCRVPSRCVTSASRRGARPAFERAVAPDRSLHAGGQVLHRPGQTARELFRSRSLSSHCHYPARRMPRRPLPCAERARLSPRQAR